jgi:hypothetical protein
MQLVIFNYSISVQFDKGIDKKYTKIIHLVYETLPHQNLKFLLYLWSFLCVSLCVFVSFLHFQRNFYKDEKSSLTHLNFYTEIIKIKLKLQIKIWKV